MIIWTNDTAWTSGSPQALESLTKSVELFLCGWRDRRLHEHICGDCDLALISGKRAGEACAVKLVVPRDQGSIRAIAEWWHVEAAHGWPHTGVHQTPTGYTGFQAETDGYQRFAIASYPDVNPLTGAIAPVQALDVLDLWLVGYPAWVRSAQGQRLMPFGVEVEDLRKLIRVVPITEKFRHQEFTLEPEYGVEEYLKAV
jgi:hypothetical protein